MSEAERQAYIDAVMKRVEQMLNRRLGQLRSPRNNRP